MTHGCVVYGAKDGVFHVSLEEVKHTDMLNNSFAQRYLSRCHCANEFAPTGLEPHCHTTTAIRLKRTSPFLLMMTDID